MRLFLCVADIGSVLGTVVAIILGRCAGGRSGREDSKLPSLPADILCTMHLSLLIVAVDPERDT